MNDYQKAKSIYYKDIEEKVLNSFGVDTISELNAEIAYGNIDFETVIVETLHQYILFNKENNNESK